MSKTKRKDHYIEVSGKPIFDKEWKAEADRKKWYKPSKSDKEGWLGKIRPGKKVAMKRAMKTPDEDGEIILPIEKKTDTWFYN